MFFPVFIAIFYKKKVFLFGGNFSIYSWSFEWSIIKKTVEKNEEQLRAEIFQKEVFIFAKK